MATLCNTSSANSLALSRSVAELYLPDLSPAADSPPRTTASIYPVPAEALTRYVGAYVSHSKGMIRHIRLQDGKLLYFSGARGVELTPAAPHRFRREKVAGQVVFELDDSGKPDRMRLTWDDGEDDVLAFHGPEEVKPTSEELQAYVGTFQSQELAATWEVREKEGGLSVHVPRNGELVVRPAFTDAFGTPGFLLQFTRGPNGSVDGFTVANPRVRGLRFQRSRELTAKAERRKRSAPGEPR